MRHGVDPGPTFKFIVHLIVMRENSNRLPALCPRGCTSCPGCSSCGTDFTDARTRSTCALNFGAAPAFGADFTDLAFLGNAARGGGFSPSGAFLAALILTCFSGQTMPAPKVRDRHSSLRGLGACRPQPSVAAPRGHVNRGRRNNDFRPLHRWCLYREHGSQLSDGRGPTTDLTQADRH